MSIATQVQRLEAFEALSSAVDRAALPNWDGDQATPISAETAAAVRELLFALPAAASSPSIEPEPDGQLCLEWYREPGMILSVSVSNSRLLHWAVKCGDEKACGTIPFVREFPRTLSYWIMRILG